MNEELFGLMAVLVMLGALIVGVRMLYKKHARETAEAIKKLPPLEPVNGRAEFSSSELPTKKIVAGHYAWQKCLASLRQSSNRRSRRKQSATARQNGYGRA